MVMEGQNQIAGKGGKQKEARQGITLAHPHKKCAVQYHPSHSKVETVYWILSSLGIIISFHCILKAICTDVELLMTKGKFWLY